MLIDRIVPLSYIFKKVRFEILYVILIGLFIQFLKVRLNVFIPEIELSMPVFLGTAISILLSFKMSQSYDRWWEARKVWGAIVNDSRTFIIQLQTFLILDNIENKIKIMGFRQIAWCYSLGQALRGLDPLANLKPFLSNSDLQNLVNHHNKPLGIIQMNGLQIRELKKNNEIDGFTHLQLDNTLKRLVDSMGRAERINSTVFPTTYRLFLHFTIYLFVIVLSMALSDIPIYYEIPLLVLLSMVFFLLEKTARHLQDPFRNRPSDIPVTAIARTIEINIKQLLNEKDVPKPLEPEDFYLM
ncbi:MAG: hypothetical protein M3Q58_14945 [Bacteroidota bacterium]|nr:hypothetical protein [Bacteroidota bacterium]